MTFQEIKATFETEFELISNKFVIIEEKLNDLSSSTQKYVYHPGVYVFLAEGNVIKVGRHLTNSRKRALEHIKVNTKNEMFQMESLKSNHDTIVLLFNLKDPNDYHWAAAVEIYLEKKLNPIIRSQRQG